MFLNQLSYQEKKMFLDLSIHAAKANNELASAEKAMINAYCTEMQLPPAEGCETEPLAAISAFFALADDHIKKIVLLELFGLVYADGSFDKAETALVRKFAEEIGIAEETWQRLQTAIKDYYAVCRALAEAVE